MAEHDIFLCNIEAIVLGFFSIVVYIWRKIILIERRNFMAFPRVLVLVPALDEEEGIGYTLAELSKVLDAPSLLVVDGKSADRTVEVAKDFGATVLIQSGRGKGEAIAQAIMNIKDNVDYVVFIDADFTYPAEYLPEMIKILEANPDVGMVCGNRFNESIHLGNLHNLLYFGNRLLAFTHNLLNGVQMQDPLTGLRVVRWEILKDWKPKSKSFDIEVELNHWVERKGYKILEIPIYYRPRLGQKKLKIRHGFTILKRILAESLT
jgi:glycosyltransferase involved in cell wall biosynthesis